MTTLTLNPEHEQTAGQRPTVLVDLIATASASREAAPMYRAPIFMPNDQSYFWTSAWQHGEADALHDIETGNVMRFSSAAAAVAWLLSDDEE